MRMMMQNQNVRKNATPIPPLKQGKPQQAMKKRATITPKRTGNRNS